MEERILTQPVAWAIPIRAAAGTVLTHWRGELECETPEITCRLWPREMTGPVRAFYHQGFSLSQCAVDLCRNTAGIGVLELDGVWVAPEYEKAFERSP